MSWIQENKFTAALAGATVVGSAVLITLSAGNSGDYDAANIKLKKALKTEANMQSVQPFPSKENLEIKKANVDDYSKSSQQLQRQFAAYRPKPEEVKDIAPDGFSKIVSGYRKRLDSKFKKNNVSIPDQCVYGFEGYASKFPRPEATGELKYQMKATEWLLSELAENSPEALLNVVRPALAIESAPAKPEKKSRRSKKSKKGAKAPVASGDPAYVAMPLELSFRSDEAGFTKFLEAIANTEKYAFVVRSMRVQNERPTPPTSGDAKFAAPAADLAADGFGAFGGGLGFDDIASDDEEATDAEAEVAAPEVVVPAVASDDDETRLLIPVLGTEKVNVFLKLELILLSQQADVSLEDMKKEAGVSRSNSAS